MTLGYPLLPLPFLFLRNMIHEESILTFSSPSPPPSPTPWRIRTGEPLPRAKSNNVLAAINSTATAAGSIDIDELEPQHTDSITTSQKEEEKPNVSTPLLSLNTHRKTVILLLLSSALFLDAFNALALSTALPVLLVQLHIPDNEDVWIFGAYQITFSGSLLLCGRISDLYNPKWVFLVGSISLTVLSIIAGFIRKEIPLLVLRALIGIGAALTIPSSQHLIVHMYPDPVSQAKALSVFASFGGLGLVSGLLFGALFVQFATWSWIFYFVAITTGIISLSIFYLLPSTNPQSQSVAHTGKLTSLTRFKKLDLFGVGLITIGLILFVFAITSGSQGKSTGGPGSSWGTAQVIVPLVLSVFLIIGFFAWERYIPEEDAAVPPQVWKYENVGILLWAATIPFMWWSSIYPLFSVFWQLVEGWSPIKVALHFLPMVLAIFPVAPLTAHLPSKIPSKWIILFGLTCLIIANVLLPFADDGSADCYWRFAFPGFFNRNDQSCDYICHNKHRSTRNNTPLHIRYNLRPIHGRSPNRRRNRLSYRNFHPNQHSKSCEQWWGRKGSVRVYRERRRTVVFVGCMWCVGCFCGWVYDE